MIKYSALRSLANENRKNNGVFAVIMFGFAGILVATLSLLDLIFSDLFIFLVLIPLLILPMIFSFYFVILHKDEVDKFSLRTFFQGFRIYFSEKFNSSFSFWKTLFYSLLIYIGTTILSLLIIDLPLYYANTFGCKEMIDTLTKLIYEDLTYEGLQQFLKENWNAFNMLTIATCAVPLSITTFFVVYSFSKNSSSIILRNDMQKYQGRYLNVLYKNYVKDNHAKYFKADLYLNWPYYVAFVLLYVLGGYLGSLYEISAVCTFTFGLAIALFFYIGVFGSFRFANKQALYEYFKQDIVKYDFDFQTKLIEDFSAKFLSSISPKDIEEDNKKDSDES